MSSKGTGLPADKSITVANYSEQFFERVKQQKYGATEEENSEVAGQNFYGLVTKLQETGSKDDVKVPLRVLRDEIGRVYFSSSTKKESGVIETLFKLYDAVEVRCQEALRNRTVEKEQAAVAAARLLEELRLRFSRLAVGDTWEAYPELKVKALKRMQLYAVRERQLKQTGSSLGGSTGRSKKSMMRMVSIGPRDGAFTSWQSTIDDLVKAPSPRLFPLLKVLLQETVEGTEPTEPERPSDASITGSEGHARSQSVQDPVLPSRPSEAVAETGHSIAELKLDDLLGLNDPSPTAAVAQAQGVSSEPSTATAAADPFAGALQGLQDPSSPAQPGTGGSQGHTNPFGGSSFTAGGHTQVNGGTHPSHAPLQSPPSGPGQAGGWPSQEHHQGSHMYGSPQAQGQPPSGSPFAMHSFQSQPMGHQAMMQQPMMQQATSGPFQGGFHQPQPVQQQQASWPSAGPPEQRHSHEVPAFNSTPYQQKPPAQPYYQQPQHQHQQQPQQQAAYPQSQMQQHQLQQPPLAQQGQQYQHPQQGLPTRGSHPFQPHSPAFSSAQGSPGPQHHPNSMARMTSLQSAPSSGVGEPHPELGRLPSSSHHELSSHPSGTYQPAPAAAASSMPHRLSGSFVPPQQQQQQQYTDPSFSGAFNHNATFAGVSQAPQMTGARGMSADGAGSKPGFNPFGLPSQAGTGAQDQMSYSGSQPLSPVTDNRFSDVGPVVPPGQHYSIPQPMRAPPAPPTSSANNQYSAW
ncbi:hypothetical protein WJX73_005817 [Symbiochloris irregularis]|uniref:Uncharacterized protein n=1 Tax=Symbiochloris irregularis TaxID=706552 RepID=A0AAW1P6G0_9CHLO